MAMKNAKTVDEVDGLVAEFLSIHDATARQGLDISTKAKDRRNSILKGSNKVLGVLKVVKKVDDAAKPRKKLPRKLLRKLPKKQAPSLQQLRPMILSLCKLKTRLNQEALNQAVLAFESEVMQSSRKFRPRA